MAHQVVGKCDAGTQHREQAPGQVGIGLQCLEELGDGCRIESIGHARQPEHRGIGIGGVGDTLEEIGVLRHRLQGRDSKERLDPSGVDETQPDQPRT
jgi:hypothetical protein